MRYAPTGIPQGDLRRWLKQELERISSAGRETGWRDITGAVLTRGVGATDPDWAQLGAGPFYAYRFALNDVMWMSYHVPHDFVPNTEVHFHTHWIPDGTDANTVKWQFDYMYAKGFDQEAFNVTGANTTAEEAGPGVQWQHMVTESAGVDLTITEPDGIIYMKMTRLTNGGTDNTDDIFVLTSDVHYQSDRMATRGKAPPFYD